jgi:hypothetical protein
MIVDMTVMTVGKVLTVMFFYDSGYEPGEGS